MRPGEFSMHTFRLKVNYKKQFRIPGIYWTPTILHRGFYGVIRLPVNCLRFPGRTFNSDPQFGNYLDKKFSSRAPTWTTAILCRRSYIVNPHVVMTNEVPNTAKQIF